MYFICDFFEDRYHYVKINEDKWWQETSSFENKQIQIRSYNDHTLDGHILRNNGPCYIHAMDGIQDRVI